MLYRVVEASLQNITFKCPKGRRILKQSVLPRSARKRNMISEDQFSGPGDY